MVKKIIAVFIAVTCLVSSFSVPWAAGSDGENEYNAVTVAKIQEKTSVFDLKAKSAILVDGISGSILLEKNSHEKLPIASVTKIMTMLLAMEAIDSGKLKFEDTVPVSEHSYSMGGSQVYLKPGEEFSVLEMMKAIAIHSANDASVAIAEKISGSEDVFVADMNEKARALGMNDTNFLDCTGLTDDGHYSSAYDIALMSRELIMKHPKILELTSTWHDTFRDGKFSLDNTNKLIRFYQGANGLKTGFTNKAGYCLSATAKRNNLQLIAVVLGEPDSNTRFAESRKLLDYGFANYELSQVNTKGEIVGTVQVKKGVKPSVNGVFGEDVKLLINRGDKGNITREVQLQQDLTAPVREGQKIGVVVYRVGDKEVGRADVLAEGKVERATFLRIFLKMAQGWFGLGRA
ncbi:MAG: D-alanyl-D-alanine carboxypeptidase family protein [Clostridiales bacterium]|jgi:D-alanyl-D-alanine carboxypeptidase (penicillin-binding protein 5/6)|nr:D-alanyl-D-alanine carboxypeptidase [Eubacteriales bacterium]MDH7565387.1 D-alanyl-D-alanine carboxypeptidase family protein [Clostridiales bacterium]